MAEGLSNQDVASQLRLSLATVKTHVGNVLAELNVNNRTQVVITAYEAGLVQPTCSAEGARSAA
ncbi:hypothetical protein GCM10010193_22990 [Kitasatospora atroaurantiaca]|uniref:response regulator transcription factor n=1 Tax=Kitasatospora atroaurantiaca TaxID=285545 RepID=UPI00119CF1AA|nr:LuxR C-terminal-related transcriptional regulator [Kitasatospora atroaurantiaca]